MTQKEFTEAMKNSIFTYYIDSSSNTLIESLQRACSQLSKGYLKIHDIHTNKSYTLTEAQRLIKLNQL